MSLSRFAVAAPVKVTMIFTAVLLLGMISLRRLPTNLFPDIRAPKVTATIRTKGLSPLEVERRINEPLERQLYTLRGVTDVTTIARADLSVALIEFTWDTELDFAFLDVKKAVGDIQRDRAGDIESASVLRYDPNAAPILTAAIAPGPDVNLEDLRRLAEQTLKPRFERLDGVANVVVGGGTEREARIALDEALMLLHDVDVSTVTSALGRENVNATGGSVTEGARQYLLKAVGEFETLDDIRRVVVKRQGDAPLLLQDIADVNWASKEPDDAVLLDGKPAIGMTFYRSAESNTVAVARAIRDEFDVIEGRKKEERKEVRGRAAWNAANEQVEGTLLPPGSRIVVASDLSEFIQGAIDEVRSNAIVGGLLAVGILLVFLRDTRTTLIIAISIPVSIVATFNLMYFQGLTLNLMTLGGLALGTGMLVDNAIVVLENIFRLRQEGKDPVEAAREGTRTVSAAIIASTLTTVVVFLPVVYVKGIAGLLFKEQALTVGYSLLASLVVALLLIPMLASKFLGRLGGSLVTGVETAREVPRTAYVRLLALCLRLRGPVLLASVALFGLSAWLLRFIPQEFLPSTEQRQIGIRLVLPNGTPLESTTGAVESLMARMEPFKDSVEVAWARVGESEGEINADTSDPDGPNTADIAVRLRAEDAFTTEMLAAGAKPMTSGDLIARLKPGLDAMPDAKAEFRTQQGSILELLGTSEAPLAVEISGEDLPALTALAGQVQARIAQTNGFANVRTNILEGSPEVRIAVDRVRLAQLGLDVQTLADTLRRRIEGETSGRIRRESGDIDLVVEVDYGEESLQTLRDIVIRTPGGAIVPLRSIADFEVERGPREVVRRHQERVARVMADMEPGVRLSDGIARARASLESMRMPTGYTLRFTGAEAERADAFGKLAMALGLSILLVYMVMASIFESFLQPLLIMLTIPLAGIGVVGGFLATGTSLNVMAVIGIVMLGGIVVNNAIVLLDCVNQVRAEQEETDAIDTLLIGCARRLRPVLMTTATTLLGLLPLALGIGEGAELRQAMAVAVLGGLLSSTVLTLFVIPVCQSYLDSAVARVRGWRRRHQLLSRDTVPVRPDGA